MNEKWKIYREQFAVSNQGTVINLKTCKKLKPSINYNGYVYVNLWGDGWRENKRYHRLLAELFIPNPKNLPQINHIDGDKTNNDLGNLEWCDNGYNSLNRHYKINKTFTEKQKEQIKKDYSELQMPALCKKYKTDYRTIRKIVAPYDQEY